MVVSFRITPEAGEVVVAVIGETIASVVLSATAKLSVLSEWVFLVLSKLTGTALVSEVAKSLTLLFTTFKLV